MNGEQLLELQNQIQLLRQELEEIRLILFKKSGAGSADIRAKLRTGSSGYTIGAGDINSAGMFGAGVVDQAAVGAGACGKSELKYEVVDVTVTAGQSSGTATITSGSIILGFYSTGNQDQLVDNVSISGTTLTITLAANATGNNTFKVVLIKA